MKTQNSISKNLIAPCGINCAVCSKYLSYINKLKRSQCAGCRQENRKCNYLFGKCTGINSGVLTLNAPFCFECIQYPCKLIERLEKRYSVNYRMSVIENLEKINKNGVEKFAREQYTKYCCGKCEGLISVHNRKCFVCDKIDRLVEKPGKRYQSGKNLKKNRKR